jgi:hypothetical protein
MCKCKKINDMEKLIEEQINGKIIYKCPCCGTIYEELPLCFGCDKPDYYWNIPENERESRIELTESLCVIDDHFFHRGSLIIPIIDYDNDLVFNIWTTISEENFRKRNELWRKAKRIKEQPYFGWLQSHIPTYENTINIKTRAFEQKVGYIPEIEVLEDSHPLTIDQTNGITLERAKEIVGTILQQEHKNE